MSSSVEAECCIIFLDSDPPPIQSGCACRSDTGLAHLDCLNEKAVSQQAHRGYEVWWECQTCGPDFTGAMLPGLGEAWWSRVCVQAEESAERLWAAHNLQERVPPSRWGVCGGGADRAGGARREDAGTGR